MKYYTGIGSRETPSDVCLFMTQIAGMFETAGMILRSGHADGADLAFENGVESDTMKEIWVPWKGFAGSSSMNLPSNEAFELASKIHPAWAGLTRGPRALHARNCHQVLGKDLATPSKMVICWTPNGEVVGGTATAIKLAKANKIPVLNLGKWKSTHSMSEALQDFLILNGEEYAI